MRFDRRAAPWLLAPLVGSAIFVSHHPYELFCLSSLAALLWGYRERLVMRVYNQVPMAALFLVAAMASLMTMGTGDTFRPLGVWLGAGLFYWTLSNGLRLPHGRDSVWVGMMGAGLICIATALSQFVAGDYRVQGPTAHPNVLAMEMNAWFPLLIMWDADTPDLSVRRLVSVLMGTGMAMIIVPTLSRTGLVVETLTLLLLAAVTLFRPASRPQRVALLAALAGVALSMGTDFSSIAQRQHTAPVTNLTARFAYNHIARAMVRDHPLGVGLEKFTTFEVQPPYRALLGDYPAVDCHSVYGLIAAEAGWAGLGLLLLIGARFWGMAWRDAAALQFRPSLSIGILAGYIAIAITSLAEYAFLRVPGCLVVLTMAALASQGER